MLEARYVCGCSISSSCFGTALGKAVKIDVLVNMDFTALIQMGKKMSTTPVAGYVYGRTVGEILDEGREADPIQLFRLPHNYFAQGPRFISASHSQDEDTGYLLFYVFNESQLTEYGDCPDSAVSELWILDAKNMHHFVANITLPQRVPYGLHGTWFSHSDVERQRKFKTFRSLEQLQTTKQEWVDRKEWWCHWVRWRDWLEKAVG